MAVEKPLVITCQMPFLWADQQWQSTDRTGSFYC